MNLCLPPFRVFSRPVLFAGAVSTVIFAACADDDTGKQPTDAGIQSDAGLAADTANVEDTAADTSADSATENDTDTADTTGSDTDGFGAEPDSDTGPQPDATADTGDRDTSDAPPDFAMARALLCEGRDCGAGTCDEFSGDCSCQSGYWNDGLTCLAIELCDDGDCAPCLPPRGPRLRRIASSETLTFQPTGVAEGVEVAVLVGGAHTPAATDWQALAEVALADLEGQTIVVLARNTEERCLAGPWYRATIDVGADYGPPAIDPASDAIPAAAAGLNWASVVHEYSPADGVFEEWADPTLALGPATGDSFDVVSLGEGGHLTLGFDAAIQDGEGWDIVVFENGFSSTFLELAWVEVSSDGNRFARFDGASLTAQSVDAFGGIEPRGLGGLAGKFQRGFGTPFDLATLRQHPLVQSGALELDRVTHVRVVDSSGDGNATDAFGRIVWDPYPTIESAGFDVEAVGAFFLSEGDE
jgi:hypothetical protein